MYSLRITVMAVMCLAPIASLAQDGHASLKTNKVTHYYVPLLGEAGPKKSPCHSMEGVCKYIIKGKQYIYNHTGGSAPSGDDFAKHATSHDELVADASCRNGYGYGLKKNCTQPCRSLAASTTHHKRGELLFFPVLVGQSCGTGSSAMTHDGYMFINDTGAKSKFNREGRFDFFWGDCESFAGGVCYDGNARNIDDMLDNTAYQLIWTPANPEHNTDKKDQFSELVRGEAVARGDGPAAVAFDLNDFLPGGQFYKE